MTQAICIIPARWGSARFPGKVLASETGKPLIQHVAERARLARSVERVIIATDDTTVRDAALAFGGEAVMTSPDHPNGTARLHDACEQLGIDEDHIVVNVQGDEPEVEPESIDQAVAALVESGAPVATCAYRFAPSEVSDDPAAVKVVRRVDGTALYFSRSRIPYEREGGVTLGAEPLHHLGLYVYRRSFLRVYAELESTPLERAESLEQLRILEHGHRIAVALCAAPEAGGGGIDTPEQYAAFVERWRSRPGARA